LGAQLKRPVLFNHGIFEAAPLWIYQSEGIRPREYSSSSLTNKTIAELQQLAEPDQRSMAFLLSNAGYNVFLLSMRGTDLSLGHRNISSATDAIYWNFSADELGLIDVRETIDYIRRLTGAPKIGYAGHSLGTMAITELLAERPEYANLVEPVFLIAQVSFISSSYSPTIGPLYRYYATRSALVQGNNAYGPFPPESQQIRTLAGTFCYRTVPIQEQLCRAIVESIGGLGQLNSSTEAVLSSVPYTQSTKVIAHLGQLTVSGRFAKFDYGIGNFARYGSVTSPDYNISAIRSNSMVFFYGLTDSLVTPADVERFFSRLTDRRTVSPRLEQQMITDHGFGYENYNLETSNGYRLSVIQLINPALRYGNSKIKLKRPVLFNHGIFEAAPLWIYQSEGIRPREYSSSSLTNKTIAELQQLAEPDQRSMAFLLSNAGYNVFLLSMRGTDLSLGHSNISSATDAIYWNFSADELGASKIGYVDHSLGIMAITKALQGDKIYRSFPPQQVTVIALNAFGNLCYRPSTIAQSITCRTYVDLIGGLSQLGSTTENVLSVVPYTTSTKVVTHLGQLGISGRFAKFDYGSTGNLAHYGRVTSPDYDVSAIRTKSMVFFYGATDSLVTPGNVEIFFNRFTVKPLKKFYYDDLWNHFDLVGAINAGERVNLPALKILENFPSIKNL
ncbi:Lipase 3, partial [Fragariocoptes setiger]